MKKLSFVLFVILVLTLTLALSACGADGKDGEDGATIEKIEYDDQGRLIITLTDGTVLDPVELPEKEEHIHTFGEWIYYSEESVHCDKALLYRICSACNGAEWKSGTEDDHDYTTVTTPATCISTGYDTKTCSNCGKIVVCNETMTVGDHQYGEYSSDSFYHWRQCKNCDAAYCDYAEHYVFMYPNGVGTCLTCHNTVYYVDNSFTEKFGKQWIITYSDVKVYAGDSINPYRILVGDYQLLLSLGEKEIHESTEMIFSSAYSGARFLEKISIPDSVTTIWQEAFYNCTSLTEIYFAGTVEQWNAIEKGDDWNYGVPATEVICSNGTVSLIQE